MPKEVSEVISKHEIGTEDVTCDYNTYLRKNKSKFVKALAGKKNVKLWLTYDVHMSHAGDEPKLKVFTTKTIRLVGNSAKLYDKLAEEIIDQIDVFIENGSGWSYDSSERLVVNVAKYMPFSGGKFVEIPRELAVKKAMINMKADDGVCFKWCITRHFNPTDSHADRVSNALKKQSESFKWDMLEFPVKVESIGKFEKANNVGVSVYGYDKSIYPLRISKLDNVVNLLYLENHYVLIKNFHRLVRDDTRNGKNVKFCCNQCLVGFTSNATLESHKRTCNRDFVAELPIEGSETFYKDHNKQMKVPFVVYADFETFVSGDAHTPSSYCYYIKSFDEKVLSSRYECVTIEEPSNDVAKHFVDAIVEEAKNVSELYKKSKKLVMKPQDMKNFDNATKCHICEEALGEDRVKDHCHLTGKYRGAAHNDCNINFRMPKFLPVFFHNLSGYDAHLFITKLETDKSRTIKCIPHTDEKYISFSYVIQTGKKFNDTFEIRFLDSFKFMSSSLDNLSKTITNFSNLESCYDNADLLKRKGVYPYEWINLERMDDKELPPIECFHSSLSGCGITNEEYERAKEIWNVFECTRFRDYHDIYNLSDVLILADVFESFREVCLKNYGLDPAWYYTSPGLSWSAMLKMTGIRLELLSDIEMVDMFKRGTRGGVSMISNRFSHANNKYMKDFRPEEESKFITYLDANNLYGWAMNQKLPFRNFEWMSESELANWKDYPCILMVDLSYPDNLHDLHSDYPLAPERVEIGKVNKLIPNLNDKEEYVLHRVALEQCLEHGLVLKKVHKGIKFEESEWLSKYIITNTELRTKSKSDFEKDFYKLMNNSIFGKTMENVESRVDVRLVADGDSLEKLTSKDTYKRHSQFNNSKLVAVHMRRAKLKYDKPLYIGMCILDLSKTLMFDFHYNHMLKKYGKDKLKLLFTDTDSLMYEIKTDDLYKDMTGDLDLYDTSDYPVGHELQSNKNKKAIGRFKDETNGKVITEFVGLRAKLYSYQVDNVDYKKCKGIVKNVIKKGLSHDDYHECLMTKVPKHVKMTIIESDKHVLRTKEMTKVALSSDDDKRIILDNGYDTIAYGHYKSRN